MKRLYYASRFSRPLSTEEVEEIRRVSTENNAKLKITGFLLCLEDMFFQMIEGPDSAVDELFRKILKDPRHNSVRCLKSEENVTERLSPEWQMNVIDLNGENENLPIAFRELFTALAESFSILSRFTQPTVERLMNRGSSPVSVAPEHRVVTVLFTDLLGFSRLSERISPDAMITLVNQHVETCFHAINSRGGEVTKLLGDGVLAYFTQPECEGAIEASLEIVRSMKSRRENAPEGLQQHVFAGIGLARGSVLEGTIGTPEKSDFTIMGSVVNLAFRLESLTRELQTPILVSNEVREQCRDRSRFESMGVHPIKGFSSPQEVFGLLECHRFDPMAIYSDIEASFLERSSDES